MRTALKVYSIILLVVCGLILISDPSDTETVIGFAFIVANPILALVYLSKEDKGKK
jgi:multisubunit Na+/H+ antiporter MnhC subunit